MFNLSEVSTSGLLRIENTNEGQDIRETIDNVKTWDALTPIRSSTSLRSVRHGRDVASQKTRQAPTSYARAHEHTTRMGGSA